METVKGKKLIRVRVADLIPYEHNPRKIPKEAVDAVVESMVECEALDPIEIDERGVILSGHTRRLAYIRRGEEYADVIQYTGLTDEQKSKYRLLANKTGELSEWDFTKLKEELLSSLDMSNFDIDWGVDLLESEPISKVEENVTLEVQKESKTTCGQIYQLGRHRLMCGDSTKADDVIKLMDGAKADLLITDPPYNVNYHGVAGSIQNDNMEDVAFCGFLTAAFKAAYSVMNPGAAFYIWHADSEGYNFRKACNNAGLQVRQCLIWNKNSLVLGRQDYQWKHEPCLYGWKAGAAHVWNSDRKQTTVMDFDKPKCNDTHPTMKPMELFDYQIKNSSYTGDKILDLFGGSGTTLAVCEQNNRTAYVMELDPHYVDVIICRWENLTGEKAVLLE